MRSQLASPRPVVRRAAPLAAGLLVAALVAVPVRAGHVLDVEGTASVAASYDFGSDERAEPVVFPGGGSLEASTDDGSRGSLDYSLSESRFVANLATASSDRFGDGRAELVVRFRSDLPLLFSLVVTTDEAGYGSGLRGEIDGRTLSFQSGIEPDPPGTRTLSGRLPAGQRVFTALNRSGQNRYDEGTDGAGRVELQVAVVPLPAPGWAGLAGIGSVVCAAVARGRLAPRRSA
jgi:hypothetical protein